MEKNPKIHDWIVSYSAVLSSLMQGRTCDGFGSYRESALEYASVTNLVNLAEPATALDLIRAGALENATPAAVNWKI
ncbi:hypothetical protein P8452_42493 [Trifolium repens]|nr:hypothetical protein P8452_42493 [Trifolium repens]